jgi:hypothetical protein
MHFLQPLFQAGHEGGRDLLRPGEKAKAEGGIVKEE